MRQQIILALSLGLFAVSFAQAESPAHCNSSCSVEQDQCLARLGPAASGNCGDGFRVCVQRCDPQRMNTAFLDNDAARRMLVRRAAPTESAVCANHCALSARSCVESGNGRNACRSAQLLCEDRCGAG